MTRIPIAGLAFGCLLAAWSPGPRLAHSADEGQEGFVPLFDGKSLDGWTKVGGSASYRVEDGTIVGVVDPGSKTNTFLRTEKTYGDFILELDAKLDVPGNSGIQFRSHQREEKGGVRVFGYQCEIDPSPRSWTAGIYEEGRRGWLYPLTGHPEAQKAFRKEDWNHFVIEARGPHLRTWLNGVPCGDVLDTMDLEGFLALQVHAGKEGQIRWKDIRLKDLGESRWSRLFDGKTLDGWRPAGGGHWAVEEGAIHGTHKSDDPAHGHLFSKEEFSDFAVRLYFRAERGNSGLYFRAEEAGNLGIKGFQAEIDPANDVGGLYETEGRGWVVKPKSEEVKTWLKPGDWNALSVVSIGTRIAVHVNGKKTAEIHDESGRKRGLLALQLHGGQDVDVRFKEVEILKLDRGASEAR